jgi:hypothetical protein
MRAQANLTVKISLFSNFRTLLAAESEIDKFFSASARRDFNC